MFKQLILIAALLFSTIVSSAASQQDINPLFPQIGQHGDVESVQSLFDEVVSWINANFDLPTTPERPAIEFASTTRLTKMRLDDRATWHGFNSEQANAVSARNVVAVYDTSSRTIFLPEGWTGNSPTEQSIFVHELVHHFQNVAHQRFECPAAREKLAYLAQAKWLEKFGMTLEKEFDLDMFTIVVSSACM